MQIYKVKQIHQRKRDGEIEGRRDGGIEGVGEKSGRRGEWEKKRRGEPLV